MNGRSSTARRLGARAVHIVLVALITAVALVATPGIAAAQNGNQSVRPTLDCIRKNTDGTYTAVLGYTNTASVRETIPVGTWNKLDPAKANGPLPTVFEPGTKRGVLTVTLTHDQWMGGPNWYLDGAFVFFGWSWTRDNLATTCPSSTELPEEGNGTGPAIGLAVAGAIGAVLVHRANRRARALTAASRSDA
jgi:hypothetical protein